MTTLSQETGICEGTLYRWRDQATANGAKMAADTPYEDFDFTWRFGQVRKKLPLLRGHVLALRDDVLYTSSSATRPRPDLFQQLRLVVFAFYGLRCMDCGAQYVTSPSLPVGRVIRLFFEVDHIAPVHYERELRTRAVFRHPRSSTLVL